MDKNRLSIRKAAKLMEAGEQFVRRGLQQGIFPFGYAVKVSSKEFTYFISKAKFTEYTGIETDPKPECTDIDMEIKEE